MMERKTIKIKEPSVLMSAEEYQSLQETLEILSDSQLVRSISVALSEPTVIRRSHKDVFAPQIRKKGKTKI